MFDEPVKAPLNSMLLLPAMVYCAPLLVSNCQVLPIALEPLISLKACRLPVPLTAVLSSNKPVPKAFLLPTRTAVAEPRVVVPL